MKKELPTNVISNELAQSSVFFQRDHDSPALTVPNHTQETQQEAIKRTATPHERTVQPNGTTERSSLLSELEEGMSEAKRGTERYSFEIFTDQKGRIEDLQYRYKKRTERKLSSSRIIREALDEYLKKAEEAL